jgi:hypothetical protein
MKHSITCNNVQVLGTRIVPNKRFGLLYKTATQLCQPQLSLDVASSHSTSRNAATPLLTTTTALPTLEQTATVTASMTAKLITGSGLERISAARSADWDRNMDSEHNTQFQTMKDND